MQLPIGIDDFRTRRTLGVEDTRVRGDVRVLAAWATADGGATGDALPPIGQQLEAHLALPAVASNATVPRLTLPTRNSAPRC